MSLLGVIWTFIVAHVTGLAQTSPMNYQEKIKNTRPSVVEILVAGRRGGTGFCVTSDGTIITATHVVANVTRTDGGVDVNYFPELSVRFSDGRVVPVRQVANPSPEASFHDITVLKAETNTPQFLRIGTPRTIQDGEEVYLMGFPFDIPAAVTYRGNVSAQFPINVGVLDGRPIQSSTIHVQAPVAKGFSGSPLLRMSDDIVVGVITNKLGGISLELDEIRQSIRRTQSQGRVLIGGVNPNATSLELINVLDNFLSAGTGWAVSIEHVRSLLEPPNQ